MVREDRLRQYHKAGYAHLPGVLTQDEAEELAREARRLMASPSALARVHREAEDKGAFIVDILMHERSDVFRRLAFDPRLLRIAAFFIGEDRFHFFYDQLFCKLARSHARTQWHQDLAFWPLEGDRIPSIWIALTDTDETGSAVQYLPGSHRSRNLHAAVNPAEREMAKAEGVDVCPDWHLTKRRAMLQSHELKAGDAVVHHPRVVHGAGPNLTGKDRIAVSMRYFAADTRWAPRANTMFFPGTQRIPAGSRVDEHGVFKQCTVPVASSVPSDKESI